MKKESKQQELKEVTLTLKKRNGIFASESFALADFAITPEVYPPYLAWEVTGAPIGFYFCIDLAEPDNLTLGDNRNKDTLLPTDSDNKANATGNDAPTAPAPTERIGDRYLTVNSLELDARYILKASGCPLPAGNEEITVTIKPQESWDNNEYRKPLHVPEKKASQDNPSGSSYELDYTEEKKNAGRGYVKETKLTDRIAGPDIGAVAWDMPSYDFLNNLDVGACTTIHPNLLQQEQMNNVNGLFVVLYDKNIFPVSAPLGAFPPDEEKQLDPNDISDASILQIRSYDLATMSFVRSKSGWIVIDPLGGEENVCEGLRKFRASFSNDNGENPIVAVIVTHSHVDHYRGIQALVKDGPSLVPPGKAKIVEEEHNGEKYETVSCNPGEILYLAPLHFYDEAVSENLYLGNSMTRRSDYMYGRTLPHDERGHLGSGLGKSVGTAKGGLYKPSLEIDFPSGDLRTLVIDGLTVSFLDAHDSEAPSECHIYFHPYATLCPGENITHTMHNLLTCRGAKIRNPKAFSRAIDRSLEEWGREIQTIVGTHHWPVWGNEGCREIMESQRDMYRFFNDQVIHGINQGKNMEEIAEAFELPPALASKCYNRGYYGSLNHNVKAVFQYYVGWWDGNPANYFRYPEAEAAHRFVECMGGVGCVLGKAREYFNKGDYRWAMELTRQVVFALGAKTSGENSGNPECDCVDYLRQARYLQADAMEQLAYGFEAGTWRNIFLTGAKELRENSPTVSDNKYRIGKSATQIASLEPEQAFEYISILVDGHKAGESGGYIELYISFESDVTVCYRLYLKNGVLHYEKCRTEPTDKPYKKYGNMEEFAEDYEAVMRGDMDGQDDFLNALAELCSYLELPNENWNIVFPLGYKGVNGK